MSESTNRNNEPKILNETKIKCFIDECIFNEYGDCKKSEIKINWDVTPTYTSYKEL